MLSVFGFLSSDNDMEANRLSKCWGLLASHLLFGARRPLPLMLWVLFSVRHASAICVSNCMAHTHMYFYLSLGRAQGKTSRAPAVMQHVNLAALLIEELALFLFLTHSNAPFWHVCQQVCSGVKRYVAQKWRSCHIRWTSRSQDNTSHGIAQAGHMRPVGTCAHGLAS